MYHSIIIEDYLDALNLLQSNQDLTDGTGLKKLESKVTAGLDYLNDICHPDGEIPLFNDAALGIAQSPTALFEYGHRLIGYRPKRHADELAVVEKKDTGYYVIRDGADMMIIDCGAVGPDYQPGHAHCDTLSYELDLDSRRIIVDSGVYDYEDSPMRRYVRSTKAHNTVAVDGEEQSEVWGVFRVARRARPVRATMNKIGNAKIRFAGAHDGYQRLRDRVTHERTIEYDKLGGWNVFDRLQGVGNHLVESYIHIHPDFRAILHDRVVSIMDKNEQRIAAITINETATISIEKSWYCPEFGLKLENYLIVLGADMSLPVEISYSIKKL